MRSVVFPLAGPLKKEDWPALREALGKCWAWSTQLANFCVTELAKADIVRDSKMEKLPKSPNLYLYPFAIKRVPGMDTQSVVAVINAVQRKYGQERIDVIWRGSASLPEYRFPYPYPISSQGWTARWLSEDEHVPVIDVKLAKQKFNLRLRGGHEFRPQLAAFRQLLEGKAKAAEMAIYRRRVTESDHRPGVTGRKPGGGEKVSFRIMVKLVLWVPRQPPKAPGKTMLLSTTKLEFWVGLVDGLKPWIYNADDIRRLTVAHTNKLQRLATDTKFEKRLPERKRMQIDDYRKKICKKFNDQINTFSHTIARMICNYAERQGVTVVQYDDTVKDFLPQFGWFPLKELLKIKLYAAHIEFVDASAKVTEKAPDPLAGAESDPG